MPWINTIVFVLSIFFTLRGCNWYTAIDLWHCFVRKLSELNLVLNILVQLLAAILNTLVQSH